MLATLLASLLTAVPAVHSRGGVSDDALTPILDYRLYSERPLFNLTLDQQYLHICKDAADGPSEYLCLGSGSPMDLISVISRCPGYGDPAMDPIVLCLRMRDVPNAWTCSWGETDEWATYFLSFDDIACLTKGRVAEEIRSLAGYTRYVPEHGVSINSTMERQYTISGTILYETIEGTAACRFCYVEVHDAGGFGQPAAPFDALSATTDHRGRFTVSVGTEPAGVALREYRIAVEVFPRNPQNSGAWPTSNAAGSPGSHVFPEVTCGIGLPKTACDTGNHFLAQNLESATWSGFVIRGKVQAVAAAIENRYPAQIVASIPIWHMDGDGGSYYARAEDRRIEVGNLAVYSDTAEHEFGHYYYHSLISFDRAYGGCSHSDWGSPSGPWCAWSEGFATWLAGRARNSGRVDVVTHVRETTNPSDELVLVKIERSMWDPDYCRPDLIWSDGVNGCAGYDDYRRMDQTHLGDGCVEGRVTVLLHGATHVGNRVDWILDAIRASPPYSVYDLEGTLKAMDPGDYRTQLWDYGEDIAYASGRTEDTGC